MSRSTFSANDAARQRSSDSEEGTKRVAKLLLIDDEEVIHRTLGDYLRDQGHEVESVLDGSRALHVVEAGDYDLVIADIRLPHVDGLSLLGKVKEKDAQKPVIMITGHGDDDLREEATLLGANAFLLKPFRLRQIDELITELTAASDG